MLREAGEGEDSIGPGDVGTTGAAAGGGENDGPAMEIGGGPTRGGLIMGGGPAVVALRDREGKAIESPRGLAGPTTDEDRDLFTADGGPCLAP
jgi:hypothetical protein